jgi:hypothetical protein
MPFGAQCVGRAPSGATDGPATSYASFGAGAATVDASLRPSAAGMGPSIAPHRPCVGGALRTKMAADTRTVLRPPVPLGSRSFA